MDSLSQIVLGAAVGEAVAGKKLGNKAVIWGAIMGTIPDLDVFLRPFISDVEELIYHRSFSHSLVFFILASPLFAWLILKVFPKSKANFKDWTLLTFLCFFTHAILDCFTTWGTQLFWPLPHRIAWQSIFVVDPLYTLPFLILIIVFMFYKDHKIRCLLNYTGLILSTGYLMFTLLNKAHIHNKFEAAAKSQNIPYKRIETRPAPLQNALWTANIETTDGFYLGYYSWFDTKAISFTYFPKNNQFITPYETDKELAVLTSMSNNLYTIEKRNDSLLIFNDLRFGQLESWNNQNSPFVFAYNIDIKPNSISINKRDINSLKTVEKRTMASIISPLWQRVKGN